MNTPFYLFQNICSNDIVIKNPFKDANPTKRDRLLHKFFSDLGISSNIHFSEIRQPCDYVVIKTDCITWEPIIFRHGKLNVSRQKVLKKWIEENRHIINAKKFGIF
jgi:hypothetical protein